MKLLLLKFFSLLKPGLIGKAAVLGYHSIGTNTLSFTVHPVEFEKQLQHLKHKEYKVISAKTLIEKIRKGESFTNTVAITFDDGYQDVYTNAYPLLMKYNFPATVFMISGMIGREKMLSEDNIKEMLGSNLIDFMPHTVTHNKLHGMKYDDAVLEIENSRRAVEKVTKRAAQIFAYPKGRFTNEIISYLKSNNNWLGAFTTMPGLVDLNADVFRLKRIPVDAATSGALFRGRLSRGFEIYELIKSSLK